MSFFSESVYNFVLTQFSCKCKFDYVKLNYNFKSNQRISKQDHKTDQIFNESLVFKGRVLHFGKYARLPRVGLED